MVEVKINGSPANRSFRNIGQALNFAANNGECINAEKLEFAYKKLNTSEGDIKEDAVNTDNGGGGGADNTKA